MQTEQLDPIPPVTNKAPRARAIPRTGGGRGKATAIVLMIVAAGVAWILYKHRDASTGAAAQPAPSVAVARVTRQDVYDEVPIPAEFRPYVESELHAMVTGYVEQMNVDIGDKVKQGDVLATLQVPELSDQLHAAQASEQQAQADYANAHLMLTRLEDVVRQNPKLVAQQDIDNARSRDAGDAAAVAAAASNVEKFQTLVNYTKIVAPFTGVITQRSADPGALVQAGTSSDRSMALLRVSDDYHLRLDFPVSVDYVKDIHVGDPVTVRVESLDGKIYTGKIARFTNQVNDETRTMMTEMELDNPSLEIVPGMYAVVLFKFDQHANALTIPTQAVGNPKDPVVNVVTAGHLIEVRPVKLGVEMPNQYEVTAGLKEGEMVMIGANAEAHPGEKVEPKIVDMPVAP